MSFINAKIIIISIITMPKNIQWGFELVIFGNAYCKIEKRALGS